MLTMPVSGAVLYKTWMMKRKSRTCKMKKYRPIDQTDWLTPKAHVTHECTRVANATNHTMGSPRGMYAIGPLVAANAAACSSLSANAGSRRPGGFVQNISSRGMAT
jgi:hypothetical protein